MFTLDRNGMEFSQKTTKLQTTKIFKQFTILSKKGFIFNLLPTEERRLL